MRVHIEFVGLDKLKITRFTAGQRTIEVKEIMGVKAFDVESFKVVDDYGDAKFVVVYSNGDGSISDPYVIGVYKKNYDTESFESVGQLHATEKREIVVEKKI